jgi:hypothetical protein
MSRVDRRLLAWVLSLGVGCLGAAIAIREVWPEVSGIFFSPGGGGLGAVSVGIPSLGLLLVVFNIVLGVIARRRGGRATRIGVICLWTMSIVLVGTLLISLTPPDIARSLGAVFVVALVVLGTGASLPVQLVVLAILTFVLIEGPRTQRAAGDMR